VRSIQTPPLIGGPRQPSVRVTCLPSRTSSIRTSSGTFRASILSPATIGVGTNCSASSPDLQVLGFVLAEEDVFGNDRHVCALSQMGARRPGLEVTTRVVSIFRFRDQRQLERWFYPDDISAWNAIFTESLASPGS
jgi:hypothetical protein